MHDTVAQIAAQMGVLHFLGHISFFISLVALVVVFWHWRFFSRAQKNELGKRMAMVFLSDMMMYISIAAYGLNWVILDGGPDVRIALKAFQVFAVFFNLYALTSLLGYYKKVN